MVNVEVTWKGEKYTITVLYRGDWGGGPLRAGYSVPASQFIGWFLHHTVMVMQDYDRDGFLHGDLDDVKRYMRVLQTVRPDLGGEVPYSWVIFRGAHDRHVIICEGRGRGRTGAHTAGYNSTFYAWSLAGNFEHEQLTDAMVAGMRWLAQMETPLATATTRGHYQVFATACPGSNAKPSLARLQPPFNDVVVGGSAPSTPNRPSEEDELMAIADHLKQHMNVVGEGVKADLRRKIDLLGVGQTAFMLNNQKTGVIFRKKGTTAPWYGGMGGRVIGPMDFDTAVAFKNLHEIRENSVEVPDPLFSALISPAEVVVSDKSIDQIVSEVSAENADLINNVAAVDAEIIAQQVVAQLGEGISAEVVDKVSQALSEAAERLRE